MLRVLIATAVVLVLLGAAAMGTPASTSRATGATASIALFEGEYIDLSKGWGAARGCMVAESAGVVECFRTRTELLSRERRLATALADHPRGLHIPSFLKGAGARGGAGTNMSCSAPLRLYANARYGGRELDFYDRAWWQNLSDWGFDDQTSSYMVGACGVDLADRANGSYPFPFIPGSTSAGHDEPTMTPGWDNRVSSIHIA